MIRARDTEMLPPAIWRAVQAGYLHPKYRGVYAVGHPRLSREGEWLAAVYAAGEEAALASFSCGRYWKISRFPERAILVATPKRRRAQNGFEIVPARLRKGERLVREAIALRAISGSSSTSAGPD